MSHKLKLAGVVPESITDGPGIRYTVFVQGCPHACPGCHNLGALPFTGGFVRTAAQLFEEISENPLLSGITFSGGEPMCQAEALTELATLAKQSGLEVAVYTGYTFEQLQHTNLPFVLELLTQADILVDGLFLKNERSLELKFKGSANQRTLDAQKSLAAGRAVLSTDERWI